MEDALLGCFVDQGLGFRKLSCRTFPGLKGGTDLFYGILDAGFDDPVTEPFFFALGNTLDRGLVICQW